MLYMRAQANSLAQIARRQHGCVTREQLQGAGIDRSRITRWIADGRLHRLHRGVYAVGHRPPSVLCDYMAAVLASGPGARLSHLPVAYMMTTITGGPPPPEVTIPARAARVRPGITLHRSRLHPLDVAELDGIPITILPRVLLDLASRLTRNELGRACHQAWVRHGTTPPQVEACIARNPHKPGAAKLRRALGSDITLSDLEDGFLELAARYRLPRPRTNIDHRGDKVDCRWPDLDLTVELLSYRYHGSRYAFETDVARRRRSTHHAFTYGDVFDRPAQTAAEVGDLLADCQRRLGQRSEGEGTLGTMR